MRTRILVISYRFNFLGEALMRTLPKGVGEVIVVHNGKTRERAATFKSQGAPQLFWEGDDCHGAILDRIFKDNALPQVTQDTDWVVCLDHDLHLLPPRFTRAFNQFADVASKTDKAVVAKARPTDPAGPWVYYWFTVPFFWVRPDRFVDMQDSWIPERRGSVTYDTGQGMYLRRPELFELTKIETGDVGMHFGSYWTTKSGHTDRFLARIRAHYCMMTSLGYFRPSEEEWKEMAEFPAFDMAIASRKIPRSY